MVSKLLADFVLKRVIKVLAKRIKPLEKYVNEENELDLAIDRLEKRQLSIEQELLEIKKRK